MDFNHLKNQADDLFDSVVGYFDTAEGKAFIEKFNQEVGTTVVRIFYYRKAKRALKRGDYATAIFWIIVWHGVASNVNLIEIRNLLSNTSPKITVNNSGGVDADRVAEIIRQQRARARTSPYN